MARPRKSTKVSFGKIGKNAKAERAAQEKKLKLNRDALDPPSWLDEQAAQEFKRVVYESGQIEILDNLDLAVLAIYATAYSGYINTVKHIRQYGYLGERETKYGTYDVVSPHLLAQEKYVKQIMSCSSKLGLATTDRLKLIVPSDDTPVLNKFLKFVT